MNYISVILGGIATVALILAVFTGGFSSRAPVVLTNEKLYTSEVFGLQFVYPKHYILDERKTGGAERNIYTITLVEDTEENRRFREGASGSLEPVSMVISAYQNSLDRLDPKDFIEKTGFTNFKRSPDGVLTPVRIAGFEGYWFIWESSYHGESLVLGNEDWVYVFSATYRSSDDQIWKEYRQLVSTIRIQ